MNALFPIIASAVGLALADVIARVLYSLTMTILESIFGEFAPLVETLLEAIFGGIGLIV